MASRRKATQSQAKPKSSTTMDSMTLKNMLRFLDEEEALLTQLQSKISEELSRLQVEEHVFLHALKIIGEKQDAMSTRGNENRGQNLSTDQEMIDALNIALQHIGESKSDNVQKGENVDTV